ncbi:MAG: hypothetical protein ACOCSF_05665, partial [Halanaeroarchaeum sp.]
DSHSVTASPARAKRSRSQSPPNQDRKSESDGNGGPVDKARSFVDDKAGRAKEAVDDTVSAAKDTVDDATGGGPDDSEPSSVTPSSARANRSRSQSPPSQDRTSESDGNGGPIDTARSFVEDTADRARRTADDTVSAATGARRNLDAGIEQAQDVAVDVGKTFEGDRGDRFDEVREAADESSGFRGGAATVADSALDLAGSKVQTEREAWGEVAEGDVGGTADEIVEGTGENAPHLARAGDAAAGSVDEWTMEQARASATEVTPHAGMSLGDNEEAWRARAKKERVMAERAEKGWESVTSGEPMSVEETAAVAFQGSEIVERMGTDTAHTIEEGSPTAGMGPEIGNERLGDVPGNVAGGIVGGIGMVPGSVGQFGPSAAADITDPETKIDGENPSEIAGPGNMAVNVGKSQIEMFGERPVSTAILFAAPGAEGAAKGVKGYRTGRSGRTIPYESITDVSGARGGVSKFETPPDAPTSRAVSEVRSRAADQPDVVQEAAGSESVLYHSTGQNLGRSLEVGEGSSELPGLWAAPDANPVGLRSTSFGSRRTSLAESLKPRKPDLSTSPDRVAAFEGESIRGMPDWATGSGYEVRGAEGSVVSRGLGRGEAKSLAESVGDDATVAPDQTTSGYQFLDEGAQEGTAYVRPTGSRTRELEAIYGPGTQFAKRTAGPDVNVRVGGREVDIPFTDRSVTVGGETLPMDFYRRAGERSPDETGGLAESAQSGAGDTASAADIGASYRSVSELGERPSGTPIQNYGTALGGPGSTTSSSSSSGDTESVESPTSVPDETGGLSAGPASRTSSGARTSRPTSRTPPSGPIDVGSESSAGGVFDERGATSTTRRGESSAPTSPPGSTVPESSTRSPLSSPPGWPPSGRSFSWSDAPRSPPGSSQSQPTAFDSPLIDPDPTRRRRRRGRDEADRDDDEFPDIRAYDVPFSNPIASGGSVLFGAVGGFGAIDETAGLQDGGDGEPESTIGFDEMGGFGL